MKSYHPIIFFLLISIIIPPAFTSAKNESNQKLVDIQGKKYLPGRIIIKIKTEKRKTQTIESIQSARHVLSSEPLFKHLKNRSIANKEDIGLSRIYVLEVSQDIDIEKMVSELNRNPMIEYAEPDYILRAQEEPNDPDFEKQHYLPQIMAQEAWDVAKGDSSVIIAIIDTGTDWNHPDLAENIWRNADEAVDSTDTDGNGFIDDVRGWDFVENGTDVAPGEDGDIQDNDPMDFDGHGTHVSGIAAARTNNEIGIASISWNVSILPLRIGWQNTDGNGVGYASAIANAFIYAADNGAHVVNLSFTNSNVVLDAARYAFENGVVIVTSAGNDNNESADPLSLAPYAISVAALTTDDRKASYSSYGDWVKVSAPGGDSFSKIFSTIVDGYGYKSGTSMAAPLVAGLAALVKSQNKDWSAGRVALQVVETADNIDDFNPAYQGKLGTGRINALRALNTETIDAPPNFLINGFEVDDHGGNNFPDAGETVDLVIELKNYWGDATNVSASLSTDDWAVNVSNGNVAYGSIPGISDMSKNTVANTLNPFMLEISENALPHRVNFELQISADNAYQHVFNFSLAISPSVLLVDDDDGDNNVENFYTSILDSLGISYDIHDHFKNGTPLIADLLKYPAVVWLCEWAFPSLDGFDRDVLSLYLDMGGNLFLSGQDIGWDLCDRTSDSNEYDESGGTSKDFYENYLHARYVADNSSFSTLNGVVDDPIGDGLSISVFQPGRSAGNQYPSEVATLDDGVSVFNYPNQNSGAVRYDGLYRTVYFAFGGYEAIVEDSVREMLMPRIINWLNGFSIEHAPLGDIEDTTTVRQVRAKIISEQSPLVEVNLFWDTDGELPFNKVEMIDDGNGNYRAAIPPQGKNKVEYFIFARTENGFSSPIEKYCYASMTDTIPPVIINLANLPNTISNIGPYPVSVEITDNVGVDPDSVLIHYFSRLGNIGESKMAAITPDRYEGHINGPFALGDTVYYQVTATDTSMARNKSVSVEKSFIIGFEDFEQGLSYWKADSGGWGLDSSIAYSGNFCINDHPAQNYPNNANVSIMLDKEFDLSNLDNAMLVYHNLYFMEEEKDFGFIEFSIDSGNTWIQEGDSLTGLSNGWRADTLFLNQLLISENRNVRLRFRFMSDSTQASPFLGWFVDDLQLISLATTVTESISDVSRKPKSFKLLQNYPNPFNPTTHISFELPKKMKVNLSIYNMLGQKIKTLLDSYKSAGVYTIQWDGRDEAGNQVSSGIFIYSLMTGDVVVSRKMVLLR